MLREFKLFLAENGKSGRKINIILQAMRIPVRYACANDEISVDPFAGLGKAAHTEKEKGILNAAEIEALIAAPITDYYARLSVLLGALCGMRRGKVRGLRWGDIGEGIITIRHNWVDGDGAKNPKRKGGLIQENTRVVPMPRAVADLLNQIVRFADFTGPDDFVIESLRRRGVPVSGKYFDHALKRELAGIGIPIDEQKRRNITFHSLRHTFVTHARLKGLLDFEIQALAGHGPKMMERYSHAQQALDMNALRLKIDTQPEEMKSLPGPVQGE